MHSPAPETTILAVDVGNSRIKFGLFVCAATSGPCVWPRCVEFLAIPRDGEIPWDRLQQWRPVPSRPDSLALQATAVMSGSNLPAGARLLAEWQCSGWPEPRVIQQGDPLPISINVDAPTKVGLDRLFKAIAVNAHRPLGSAAIIIDSGTATTVDLLEADGSFCGGTILPGFALSATALHHYTALLPLLTVRELAHEPPVPLGKNTADAIRAGVYWGQVGAIRELVHQLTAIRPANSEPPRLYLTGGGGPFLVSQFPTATHVPSLGMYGMILVAAGGTAG